MLSRAERPTPFPMSGRDALKDFTAAGYELISVLPGHAAAVDSLPVIHRDPFDRILIAQAITEPLRLLTHDKRLPEYRDSIILV